MIPVSNTNLQSIEDDNDHFKFASSSNINGEKRERNKSRTKTKTKTKSDFDDSYPFVVLNYLNKSELSNLKNNLNL